jgi:hypothetical protein
MEEETKQNDPSTEEKPSGDYKMFDTPPVAQS